MKRQSQYGFALILEILLVLAVIGTIGLVFLRGPGKNIFSKEAACTADSQLTTSPIELAQLPAVFPLGNINAPVGHIFPSDHAGFSLQRIENPNTPGAFKTVATDIHAPGIVQIFNVRKTSYSQPGQSSMSDYSLNFKLCRGLEFYFGHVHTISTSLNQLISTTKGDCQERAQGDKSYQECEYPIDYKTTAGEIIGNAGGSDTTVAGIDFGAVDRNKPALDFIRKKGVPESTLYAHCPLDYFAGSLKDQLKAKIDRQTEPKCGEVMQDKPGTLQGDWYLKNKGSYGNWSSQLAMLHNVVDPTEGVVSVGGTIGPAGNFNFTPAHQGLVNREPSEVTSGGQVYCYYSITTPNSPMASPGQTRGQVLLQLVDGKTLKAEHQDGNCSGSWSFRSPTTYTR
jgi:hypothetical protein